MIYIKNTPNYAGVAIYGDYLDFDNLYEALYDIVGGEDEYTGYERVRIRVLGMCYDIRHALMGHREIEFVDNGLDEQKMKYLSIISSKKNLYLVVHVLWPEILFITMALNDLIRIYANKRSRNSNNPMFDKRNIWDVSIAIVREFQAVLAKCIKGVVTEASYNRMFNLMIKDYNWLDGYLTQYVDIFNLQFLKMNKDNRRENISIIAKRLAEQGLDYQKLRDEVVQVARKNECSVDQIRLKLEYPEEIIW
jgi:hypothetical protein